MQPYRKKKKVSAIFIATVLPIFKCLQKNTVSKLHVRSSTYKLALVREVTPEHIILKVTTKQFLRLKIHRCFHDKATRATGE